MKKLKTVGIVSMLLAAAAACFAGGADVKIKMWRLPSDTHYPHDPLVSHDGYIWYTGNKSNNIGRFDPKTETFKEWSTDIPNSGPHGIVEDKDGNIWFTANMAKPTYIGKFDPRTEKFTVYPVKLAARSDNDPEAAGAHTLTFDQKGNIWFTMLNSDMIGRLDPKTGKFTIARSAQHPVGPYGIVVNSKGVPYFTMFRTNKLGSIDPDTMAVHLYDIPNPDARPRRLTIAPDDVVWYTDFERGMLGRFDPKTGAFSEWPSPGGAWSRPYPLLVIGNAVWYNESWLTPTTIVRFDIETHETQSWPVENCDDGMYLFYPDKNGFWFTCHGTDRLGKVEVNEGNSASKVPAGAGKGGN